MNRFPILLALFLGCVSIPAELPAYKYANTVDVGMVSDGPMGAALERFTELVDDGQRAVTLRIDSPGGEILLGTRWTRDMEDLKKRHGVRVTCIVDGAAYSMAAVILESQLCDARLATSRSTILFHNGSTGAQGTAAFISNEVAFLEALNVAMALGISARLGMDLETYRAKVAGRDWVLAVPEALQHNVIDGVVSSADIAPPKGDA